MTGDHKIETPCPRCGKTLWMADDGSWIGCGSCPYVLNEARKGS